MEVDRRHGQETRYKTGFKKRTGQLILSDDHLDFTVGGSSSENVMRVLWKDVVKHQVSPASFTKAHLLRLIMKDPPPGMKKNTLAFSMENRQALEAIRTDVSQRLNRLGVTNSLPNSDDPSRKRPYSELNRQDQSFGSLDPTAMAVARSTILAANPTLRHQHKHLVIESKTISEDDFWATHHHLLEDEYAKISGMTQAGNSSVLQSHLPSSGKVKLGVQQMRQIFILYPAVHRAYEEKVPLELSDEQFWRKYLESEFFHRDRGRLGTVTKNHAVEAGTNGKTQTYDIQDARAAAIGTDDLFSRYDQKIRESDAQVTTPKRKWGTKLAIGQFDLASTFETERGKLLEGPKDNHPPNQNDDGKGARVIQKYNRHWAVVLHPDEAIAGSDLTEVARCSQRQVQRGNKDAFTYGGVDDDMRRLVDYAVAATEDANHAVGLSVESEGYEELTLRNIQAYYAGNVDSNKKPEASPDAKRRHSDFAKAMAATAVGLVQALAASDTPSTLPATSYPNPNLGKGLLKALTKLMEKGAQTDEDSLKMVQNLPDDFRKNLQSYFRRSSELLRHFFGLRTLEGDSNTKKLARIVSGMESFYREMEEMRRNLPQTSDGELMRKMCLPLMRQLDWAFKLYREGTGGGGGGFVAVN